MGRLLGSLSAQLIALPNLQKLWGLGYCVFYIPAAPLGLKYRFAAIKKPSFEEKNSVSKTVRSLDCSTQPTEAFLQSPTRIDQP